MHDELHDITDHEVTLTGNPYAAEEHAHGDGHGHDSHASHNSTTRHVAASSHGDDSTGTIRMVTDALDTIATDMATFTVRPGRYYQGRFFNTCRFSALKHARTRVCRQCSDGFCVLRNWSVFVPIS